MAKTINRRAVSAIISLGLTLPVIDLARAADAVELLNVSYDPTREFYEAYNKLFATYWGGKTGQEIKIKQSHGGSGKQARAVIDGLRADVVTLALAYDIDAIAGRARLLPPDWQQKLPHNSSPYTSTIVFLVRKGNPRGIRDWDDLVKPGIAVITPNPKTSGAARWGYLAAWGFAGKRYGGEEKAREFVARLFRNVPVLDAGARGATTTFAQRGMGDVLLTWENEAYLAKREFAGQELEIIVPSISVLAEPPVAVVEKNAARRGALETARAYLEHLYSAEAQELIAAHFYRPSDPAVAGKNAALFPNLTLLDIQHFGGWKAVQARHFDDDGVFDQIYAQ